MTNSIIHVLVVEDEQVLREVYKTILSLQGYRVSIARNGLEALQILRESTPDMILLDVLMPEMDGLEFMRNYDAETHTDTKIIINSNVSDLDTINDIMLLGAHGHVLKSDLTPNALVELIEDTTQA